MLTTFQFIQFQARVEPTLTTAQFPENVTADRWEQPWSLPVRFARDPRMAIALAASSGMIPISAWGMAQQESPFAEKWEQPWSLPKRFPLILRADLNPAVMPPWMDFDFAPDEAAASTTRGALTLPDEIAVAATSAFKGVPGVFSMASIWKDKS